MNRVSVSVVFIFGTVRRNFYGRDVSLNGIFPIVSGIGLVGFQLTFAGQGFLFFWSHREVGNGAFYHCFIR